MRRRSALVLALLVIVAAAAVGHASQRQERAEEPPEWLVEQGRALMRVEFGEHEPKQVTYLLGERRHLVVYDFGREVSCRGPLCSPPPSVGDRRVPGESVWGAAFDAKTRRATGFGACSSVTGCNNMLRPSRPG